MIEPNIKLNTTRTIQIRQLVSQKRGLTANPHYLAVNGTFLVMDDQDTKRNIFGVFLAGKSRRFNRLKSLPANTKNFGTVRERAVIL